MKQKERNFFKLYSKHQREIYSYIFNHVVNSADADDIMQQTSLALWDNFNQFEEGSNFIAWARSVAYFRILRFRQKSKRSRIVLSEETFLLLEKEYHEDSQYLEQRGEALAQCLGELRIEDRKVFESVYNREISLKSAALQLNRKVKSLYNLMSRLREKLRLCIEGKLVQ